MPDDKAVDLRIVTKPHIPPDEIIEQAAEVVAMILAGFMEVYAGVDPRTPEGRDLMEDVTRRAIRAASKGMNGNA